MQLKCKQLKKFPKVQSTFVSVRALKKTKTWFESTKVFNFKHQSSKVHSISNHLCSGWFTAIFSIFSHFFTSNLKIVSSWSIWVTAINTKMQFYWCRCCNVQGIFFIVVANFDSCKIYELFLSSVFRILGHNRKNHMLSQINLQKYNERNFANTRVDGLIVTRLTSCEISLRRKSTSVECREISSVHIYIFCLF